MKNKNGVISLVSALLGIACIATSIAYLVWRGYNERAYREKWKDYNDCGVEGL